MLLCFLVRTLRTWFSCICRHAGCYAGRYSLALADMRDDTLGDLLFHLQRCGILRWEIFFCRCRHAGSCRHAGCYAGRSSLALADMQDDTLGDLLLHLRTCGMLRWEMASQMKRTLRRTNLLGRSAPATAHADALYACFRLFW